MAQGQRHRRLGVIKLGRRQHLGEAHDLAIFVRDLDTHRGFTGDHFNHPHAGHGQRACQVFGQVGDTANLDPGCWLNLVTGNHRARVDRVNGHLDPELLELDFKQVANGRQGFRGVIELLLLGRIKNRNRRQSAFNCAVDKQRHLLLFLHALAWLWRFGRCRGNHCWHVLFALGHVLGQCLLTLNQALFGLGLLALVGNARRDHFANAGVHFTQLRNQLLALIAV